MRNDQPRNHLKAWRLFRQMTQVQLADAIGTSGAVISLLEAGERQLSPKWLEKIAPVLQTSVGHLLEVDPNELDNDVMEIWTTIPQEKRQQARDVLKTFQDKNVVEQLRLHRAKPPRGTDPRGKTSRDEPANSQKESEG
jgi:transcriptional regulator with XRE-family HTH domain